MLSSSKAVLFVLTGPLAVATVFFNGYILLSALSRLRQKQRQAPSETIIVALALAAIAYQLVCYLWMSMDQLDTGCRMDAAPYTVMLLLVKSMKFIIMWDISFLTFYYSSKLVTAAQRHHAHIQAVLAHATPTVVLIPVCGLVTCMPMLAVFRYDNQTLANEDCGVLVPYGTAGSVYEVAYLLLADVLPGLVMVRCCASISVHLAVHLRHMKASTNGTHGPRLGSQRRVIQMALSLVAIFIVFLVVDLYVQYQISVHHENILVLTFFFTSIYTTVTALVLIYGKKSFWQVLTREFNALLHGCCLACQKVPEHKAKASISAKVKS
ncbi:unnamed protein product [Tetraodon nigroviridis]|uniref:Taste receptor type 2 n=1 Tax=Tetraodon nigroviridis TaxID=99883 RepID=Q4SA10_TETNG|nr:unnamed protein product [Tetraodon nigroviridis]